MKKLYKILFVVIAGLFTAGIASASLGEYWSTISHIIPRTNDTVDIGSAAKKVRTLFINNLTCTDCVDDTNVDWGTGTNEISSADIPDHDSHSIRDTFVHIVNRGKSEAITITLTGGLNFSWSAGEIYDIANHTFVSTDAGSGSVTNNAVNYLKWVSGTTLTISTSDATGNEVLVATGSVYDGVISGYREASLMDESTANARRGLRALFPTRIISGMSVHEDADATNALDITMDAGVIWKEAMEKMTPVEIKSRTTAMVRHFHTGGVWDSDTNAQIETTNYDNGTAKTAIPANKYVKGMFIFMNGKIGFVYPTEYFNTIAQAQAGALPVMPTGLEPIPKLTAIVYQQGAVNFTGAVWQDVRAGISEENFNGVTDHGALAGLSDDDHTQYTLADGTRAFTGTQTFNENIEMKDDKKLYFDTAKTNAYIKYDSSNDDFFINNDIAAEGILGFYSNASADGSGTWSPYFDMTSDGTVSFVNHDQGNIADRYFKIAMNSGLKIITTGCVLNPGAILEADNIATTDKTFQFPNYSGTFITSGNLTDITTVGTIAAGTWNGTSIADANVDNNITVTGYMQDTDIDTFAELQSWVADETLLKAGVLTDTKYCTYDSASGDIICNSTPAGDGDITAVFDCATGDCNTMTVGTSEYLTYGTGYINANRFAGVTTVDATEFGYLNGLTAAIVQAGSASHDGFSDYVANEHIDWTADQGATNIHSGNYTAGLTNLTDFDQTAWRLFYSNNLGDVIELSLGTDGQYLKSQGGTSSLTWSTPTDTTYTGGTGITLTGTVFSTTDSEIVHDNLSGFVANEHLDWTGDLGAVNIHAGNYTDTNTTYLGGTNLTLAGTTFNVDDAFVINSGSDIIGGGSGFTHTFNASAGSDSVFTFGDGTVNLSTGALQVGGNAVLTGNETITLSGDVAGSGATAITTTIGANKILESHLKAVDAAADEECLTYEATTGDFEWQTCGGSLAINDITDITIDTPADNEVLAYNNGTSTWLNQTPAEAGLQSVLTNSAGLLAALSDETGTGLSVFSTSPTFTTPLLGTPTSGVLTNCTGTASGLTAGNVTTNANLTGDITSVGNATTITADVITHADIADSDQTDTKCFYLESPTADDDLKSIWRNSTANNFLLTEIWGESDQNVAFDLQIDDSTPADVSGTDINPNAGEAEDTTLTGDTTLAASEELDLIITSVSGTPTWLSVCFTGQWVD